MICLMMFWIDFDSNLFLNFRAHSVAKIVDYACA